MHSIPKREPVDSNYGSTPKLLFVVSAKRDVETIYATTTELKDKSFCMVKIVSIDYFSKPKTEEGSEQILVRSKVPFTRLEDYGTTDILDILLREMPSALVVLHDQEFINRAFILAAKRMEIPVLLLLFKALSSKVNKRELGLKRTIYKIVSRPAFLLKKYRFLSTTRLSIGRNPWMLFSSFLHDIYQSLFCYDLRGTFGCTVVAVGDEYAKNTLIARGVPEEKIAITSHPELSTDTSFDPFWEGDFLDSLSGSKIILFLTSSNVEHGLWTSKMREEFVISIVDSISPLLNQETRLVLKIHPLETLVLYKSLLSRVDADVILCKNVDLGRLLGISDVVVTVHSSVVSRALFLGKPVVIVNLFGEPEYLPYVKDKLAIGVYEVQDLRKTIEALISNTPSREEYMSRVEAFRKRQEIHQKTRPRVVEVLLDMISK